MPSTPVILTDPLPLSLTLFDGANGLYPQAEVYDSLDAPVAGSPFNLTEVGSTGRYTSTAFTPVTKESFTALFIVYTDAGHSVESATHGRVEETYTVSSVISDVTSILDKLIQFCVAAQTTAIAGGNPTEIWTGLTQADNYFNNMQVLVINAAGPVVRNIDLYEQTNGKITVVALPFTPVVGDVVIILARTGSVPLDIQAIVDGVLDEDLTTHMTPNSLAVMIKDLKTETTRMLALNKENVFIDNVGYDPVTRGLITWRVRGFANKADTDNANYGGDPPGDPTPVAKWTGTGEWLAPGQYRILKMTLEP